jgi:hypothetical protein
MIVYETATLVIIIHNFRSVWAADAGTLTRRHRIPKPPPEDHLFYRADDLNLGVELCIYGRALKLTNCDEFTRQFLQKLGVRVNKPIQIPADPYMDNRKAVSCRLRMPIILYTELIWAFRLQSHLPHVQLDLSVC